MIGPTTILTAAHCLHDGTGWYSTRAWSPGVDSEDSNPFPYQGASPYPNPAGTAPIFDCYHPVVPNEYLNGNTSVSQDFATLELSSMYPGNCNLNPGTTVGWHGLWVASEATLEASQGYIFGYPGEKTEWPQIWGSYAPLYDDGMELEYEIDTTGGQSGSAIYKFDSADVRYVVGVHRGYKGNGMNHGRRMSIALYNWILTHSAL